MSLSIDSRMQPPAPPTRKTSYGNPLLEDSERGEECTGEAGEAVVCVSDRFLHSDENLEECHEDENDLHNSHPLWAHHRQLHRSVSVDDLMEYQREFRERATTDMTDYQREFQAILADGVVLSSSNHNPHYTSAIAVQQQQRRCRGIRNSIANSDLAEFKRQFCQERAAHQSSSDRRMRRDMSADDAKLSSKEKDKKQSPTTTTTTTTTTTLNHYQWGTRSLRRAILGSDLGTFERSVRTALLESSREESSASDDSDDDDEDIAASCDSSASSTGIAMTHRDSQDLRRMPFVPITELDNDDWGTRSLRKSLKDLVSDQDYDFSPPFRPKRTRRVDQQIPEEELELPLDAALSSPWNNQEPIPSSNGLKMPRRVISGETDPSRNNNDTAQEDDRPNISKPSSSKSRSVSMGDIGTAAAADNNNNSPPEEQQQPEFEWQQMRSRSFRRSISSSDIEKYQRHLETGMLLDDDHDNSASTTDSNNKKKSPPNTANNNNAGDNNGSSLATIAVVESTTNPPTTNTTTTAESTLLLHPLMAPASSPLISADDDHTNTEDNNNHNQEEYRRARRSRRRRHRRSNSDEPELLIGNNNNEDTADIAPRKPTRTTSRPVSPPPPPPRAAVVRFADNQEVVEIPKVSEDMKPHLFYTKRDVKRFRMNEHRRQEESIRNYMEYLNQKENALDANSPSIYD